MRYKAKVVFQKQLVLNKYVVSFKFGINNACHIESPMILINSIEYFFDLKYFGMVCRLHLNTF